MADLFKDILPSIQQTKKVVITQENERDYVPFVVNRSISFHLDMVMPANQMNQYPSTEPLLQYHYLLHSVRGYKRPFQKWQKREDIDDLSLIKDFYNYSNEKAKEAMSLLTQEQIKIIRNEMSKGGIKRK
jgi:hypothetical protein